MKMPVEFSELLALIWIRCSCADASSRSKRTLRHEQVYFKYFGDAKVGPARYT